MKIYETKMAKISLIEERVIRVELVEGAIMTMAELEANAKIYRELLGKHEKGLFLVLFAKQSMGEVNISNKSAVSERSSFKEAEAILIHQPSHMLEYNFYKNHYNPSHDVELFENEDEAVAWLLKYKQ